MKKKHLINIFLKKFFKIFNKKNKPIPLHEPIITKEDVRLVTNCLKTTFVSSTGKRVIDFENKIKKLTKSRNVISVVNGTCGLHLALKVLGVKKNEEVLLPSLTFAGTVNAVLGAYGIPHFIDSDYETLGANPDKLINYLKKNTFKKKGACFNSKTNRRIRVLIVVHVFGHAAQIHKLKKICDKFKIYLLEDAAECIGSYYKNRHLGSFGNIGVISFNGNKTITTGGGGVILTNNSMLAKKLRHLSGGAKLNHKWEYIHDQQGYNFKLPALNASLGISQLSNLNKIIKMKRELYEVYKINFENLNFITVFKEPKNSKSNYWLQTLILQKNYKNLKNNLLKALNKSGFMSRPAWKPLHMLKHLKNYPKMNLDTCEDLYSRIINIPSSPNLIKKI